MEASSAPPQCRRYSLLPVLRDVDQLCAYLRFLSESKEEELIKFYNDCLDYSDFACSYARMLKAQEIMKEYFMEDSPWDVRIYLSVAVKRYVWQNYTSGSPDTFKQAQAVILEVIETESLPNFYDKRIIQKPKRAQRQTPIFLMSAPLDYLEQHQQDVSPLFYSRTYLRMGTQTKRDPQAPTRPESEPSFSKPIKSRSTPNLHHKVESLDSNSGR